MVRRIVLFFPVLLTFTLQPACEANPLLIAKASFNTAVGIYKGFQTVKSIFGLSEKDDKTKIIENQEKNSKLFLQKLDQLSEDLDSAKTQILDYFLENVEKKIDVKISELSSYVNGIEKDYQVFVDYFKNTTRMRRKDLKDFANECLKVKGLSRTVLNMHEAFVQKHSRTGESMISIIISKKAVAADTVCYKGLSAQQFIWYLYEVIAKADSKAMLTKLFALDTLEQSGWRKIQNNPEKQRKKHHKYDQLRAQERMQYFERLNATLASIKEKLAIASRELWRCDPKNHQNGTTYAKIGEVLQGHFVVAEDMASNNVNSHGDILSQFTDYLKRISNPRHRKCTEYKHEELTYKSPTSKAISFNKRCHGDVWDCKAVDGDQIDVCFATGFDERQYFWARVHNTDNFYGQSKSCKTQIIGDGRRSKMCYCTCQTRLPSKIRFFSLNSETSEINENKVVTGVQIKELNNVFYIQIQQGKLAENGSIIGNPVWKQEQPITNYREHYQIEYKQKTVYLDDFNENGDKVVTGLRFKKVDHSLRLEVRFTPFDYVTGKLDLNAPEVWQHNANKTIERSGIDVNGRHDPSASSRQSEIFSRTNQYINFGITNLKSDVGQNTIPYIDVQPVEMVSPSPLSGAGIYHKSDGKSGGFLGLKIFNYDYSQHIA